MDLEPQGYDEEDMVNYRDGVDIIATLALSPSMQILDIQSNTTSNSGIFSHIRPTYDFYSLFTLKIQLPVNLDLFYNFARHCPNVTHAQLIPDGNAPYKPAPVEVLPRLRKLNTIFGLVPIFGPGRPIDSLEFTRQTISTAEEIETIFKAFARDAPGLKSLRFLYWDLRPGYLRPIAAALPGLEELKVSSVRPNMPKWEIEELEGR